MTKKEITTDFIKKVNELIASGAFDTQKAIVDKIGWTAPAMSAALKGERPVPLDKYNAVVNLHKIGNHMLAEEQATYIVQSAEREEYKDKYIKELEKKVELQARIIELLEEKLK